MRVLFVDQTGQLGGGELSLLDVIRATGHTAEVVLFTDGPFRQLLEEIPVPVHILAAGGAGEVRREAGVKALLSAGPSLLRLRNDLARIAKHFDVIYANSQKAFIVSALAKKAGQPLLWHLRDILDTTHFSAALRGAAVFAGNRTASLVVANSHATLDSLIAAGGRSDKAKVIYNGISPVPFDAVTQAEVDKLRRELGWEGRFVVGAFGRITEWKGQHVLIDALCSMPGVHAAIIGDALFGEQEYVDALRARVRQQGVADRVHFLGFRRDIPQLMRAVNIVAHTAIAPEPFGRVIVEGMLARRPVVATRAGGAAEIVQDRDNGLLVPPGDVRALAAAIEELKNQPQFSELLVAHARDSAEDRFSITTMVREIDTALDRLEASS